MVYEPSSKFEIVRVDTIKDGNDITLNASRFIINDAYVATEIFEKQEISALVVNIFT